MKSNKYFEQSWQDAFESAALAPSPEVWAGIEHALDQQAGRKGWLPLLLIAASVSLAMAFPFTIGDSQLPFEQINNYQPIADAETENSLEQSLESQPLQNENYQTTNPGPATASAEVVPVDGIQKSESSSFIPVNALNSGNTLFAEHTKVVTIDGIGYYGLSSSDIPYYLAAGALKIDLKTTRGQLIAVNLGAGSGNTEASPGGVFSSAAEFADAAPSGLNAAVAANVGEESRRGTIVGFGLEIPVGKRTALQFGLNYFNSRANGTSNRILESGGTITPLAYNDYVDQGMAYTDTPFEYTVTDNYINLPVIFKYPFLQRKLVIRGGIGTGVDLLISHVVKTDQYGRAAYSGKNVGMSPVWINGVGNIDIGYWIVPKYLLSLEAGYRLGFGLGSNSAANNIQSNFMVGIKLNYQLK